MFADLCATRAIQAGLVFFLLVVGRSLLYSWHVHRTTDAELAYLGADPGVLQNEPQTTQHTIDTSPVDFQ